MGEQALDGAPSLIRSVVRAMRLQFCVLPSARGADFAAMEVKAMTPALDAVLAEICRTGVTMCVALLIAWHDLACIQLAVPSC